MAAYVPIDLHRHRSVVMRMAETGEVLGWTRLANDPETLAAEVLKAGEAPEVAIEATWTGFTIPDAFVVGYGIDFAQRNRNLPHIGAVRFLDEATPAPAEEVPATTGA